MVYREIRYTKFRVDRVQDAFKGPEQISILPGFGRFSLLCLVIGFAA